MIYSTIIIAEDAGQGPRNNNRTVNHRPLRIHDDFRGVDFWSAVFCPCMLASPAAAQFHIGGIQRDRNNNDNSNDSNNNTNNDNTNSITIYYYY